MKQFTTELRAINPKTGLITLYSGPNVPGLDAKDAERYCKTNGLGYCIVTGELICEVPIKDGLPDWNNRVDYDKIQNN